VYDDSLLGPDSGSAGAGAQPSGGGDESGGAENSAGKASSAGAGAISGANAAGGKQANGGASGEAGTPEEAAGADNESGGAGAGGASAGGTSGAGASSVAGASVGGAPSGGGAGRGGASSGGVSGGGASGGGVSGGGASGGGGSPLGDALVDNMQHTTATYANAPFVGAWSRVALGDMQWVAADVPSMFQKRADSATDMSFRVAANCPTSGNCAQAPSDVEVIVTLNNGAAVDISAYTGVSFFVNRVAGTGNILRVAIDDGPSHQGSTSCNGMQLDCGREVEWYVVPTDPYAISAGAWTKYKMPFSSFAKNCGWMCTRQNALSTKEVYSLRFRIDRNISGTSVTKIDFEIDELYLYK